MSGADFTDHPLKIAEQLKDSHRYKEEGDQYSFYLVENVIRACDELYEYCLVYMDPALCHEAVIFLQSIAYDFVALNEWFKLKTVCKDLPPPVRTSVSPSQVSHHLRKMSRTRSFRRAKSEPRLNKPHFSSKFDKYKNEQKSAGVNVSAPDFVPSYTSEIGVGSSSNYGLLENQRNIYSNQSLPTSIDSKSGFQGQFYSNSVEDYHEDGRPVNTSHVNLSYTQNVIPPNFWHYSPQLNLNPFHHPTLQLPHHYVSHFHLPYSLYTGTGNLFPVGPLGNVLTEQMQCSVNSGMNHSFEYSANETFLQPLDTQKHDDSEDIRPPSSFSDDSDIVIVCNKTSNVSQCHKSAENRDLPCASDADNKEDLKEVSLPLHSSEIEKKLYIVNKDVNEHEAPLETLKIPSENTDDIITISEPLPPDKNRSEPTVIIEPSVTEQSSSSHSKSILGLGEDECQIHFPELKPIDSLPKQKFRHKTISKTKPIKPCFEITCSINSAKLNSNTSVNKEPSDNIAEEKGSFSKLFKPSSIIEKPFVRTSSNTNKRRNKSTNLQLSSLPLKQNTKIIKEMNEKGNSKISTFIDDENNDSDGWETVKVRSKWRDQNDARQSRFNSKFYHSYSNIISTQTAGVRHNGKPSNDYKPQHNSYTPRIQRSSLANHSVGIIKSSGSDEELVEKLTENKPSKAKQNSFQGCNLNEKNLEVEKCFKKGRRYSSNYVDKANGCSKNKEIENVSFSEKAEKIDPNEMYSAYMQYINNVDEENQDTESKNDKSILHPDAGKEVPQSVASLEEMTDFVNRDPIRALEFKKKLADEIKHQEDVKRRNEVKQELAQKKRLEFLQCKTAKVREFVQKVEEVKAAQHQLALQRKSRIDLKLKKAEENRNMHLNIIKKKAHDEEEKLKEIAFINELEAQNRRHDSLALRQEHEERLQCLVEERQRRLEEKAAREAAVEERRRVLEAERQEKLEKMKEKRRRKQEIIDRKQQEREQERLEIAREKAREREERLQARQSAQLATVEELQKRIQQKQEESARRHVECIELIRQKAVEIGLHRNTFENIPNYISMYKPEEQLKTEISNKGAVIQEKHKIHLKKRCKKIKTRMATKGGIFIESFDSHEHVLNGKDQLLEKLLGKLHSYTPHHIYLWQDEECSNIDHYLNEMLMILHTCSALKNSFRQLKGYILINSIIHAFNNCAHDKLSTYSLKCILKIINICQWTCNENQENCLYIVLSNAIATLLDSLKFSLKILNSSNKSWETLAEALLKLDSSILESVNHITEEQMKSIPDFLLRMKDLISYIMCSGLITVTVDLFRASEIDDKFMHSSLILPCINLFGSFLSVKFAMKVPTSYSFLQYIALFMQPNCLLYCHYFHLDNCYASFKTDEFMNVLKTTDLLGTVPLLYEGLMQHITKDGSLPEYSLPIINFFLKLAVIDLKSFQDILGSEGIALQWRGIASGLMMLCVRKKYFGELLHNVIKSVGYFSINNKKNQTLIQSGKHPTVLQQLVKLPFQYFCDPKHMELLFPTLIACSFQNTTNKAIVENELNYSVLESFMSSPAGKHNKLIMLLFKHQNAEVP